MTARMIPSEDTLVKYENPTLVTKHTDKAEVISFLRN